MGDKPNIKDDETIALELKINELESAIEQLRREKENLEHTSADLLSKLEECEKKLGQEDEEIQNLQLISSGEVQRGG